MRYKLAAVLLIMISGCAPTAEQEHQAALAREQQMTPEQRKQEENIKQQKFAELTKALKAEKDPIACKVGKECERKWSRAVEWVTENAGMRIQTQTDALIETYSPVDFGQGPGFRITKFADGDSTDSIKFTMKCYAPCDPPVWAWKAKFVNFISGKPS